MDKSTINAMSRRANGPADPPQRPAATASSGYRTHSIYLNPYDLNSYTDMGTTGGGGMSATEGQRDGHRARPRYWHGVRDRTTSTRRGRGMAAAGVVGGVLGPVVFTGAWIAGSLRQAGHPLGSIQLSGLAAPDARDPWIMITGFLVLGGCTIVFGLTARNTIGGPAPVLIGVAGALTIAAGLLRRDHLLLVPGPASWHSHAHDLVSAAIYVDLVLAQVVLARRFGRDPAWRRWRWWPLLTATATAALLVAFTADTSAPDAGILQRIAVSIPLAVVAAVAVRLACGEQRPPFVMKA
jgi:Protein of unknown function (DUF998)